LNPPIAVRWVYICRSSSIDGKNQSENPPPLYAIAVSDAPVVHADATAAVFVFPEPIDVPVEPEIEVDALLHQAIFASEPPFQLFGAASKNSPLELPLVAGVMKMIPPPGPISPTTHELEHG
jgi:hypothetical protein